MFGQCLTLCLLLLSTQCMLTLSHNLFAGPSHSSLVTEIAPSPGDQYSVQGPGGTRFLPLVHLSPPLGYLRWEVLCEPLALSASRGSLLYFAAYVPPSQPLPFICVLQSGRQSRPQLGLPLLTPVVNSLFHATGLLSFLGLCFFI